MKVLFLLFFLASPALSHQVLFNNSDFLKLANGDPIAGHELYTFCAAAGKDFSRCKELFSREGKTSLLAARFCVQSFLYPKDLQPLVQGKDFELKTLEKNFTYGKIWHEDYQNSAEGRHFHAYSEDILDASVASYSSRLIQDKIARNHARAYVSSKYHFTDPRLSKEEIAALKKEGERVKSFPYLEYIPNLLCMDEKNCLSGSGPITRDKVIKAIPPTPSKISTYAEECLKDELKMITTGLRGVIRD